MSRKEKDKRGEKEGSGSETRPLPIEISGYATVSLPYISVVMRWSLSRCLQLCVITGRSPSSIGTHSTSMMYNTKSSQHRGRRKLANHRLVHRVYV